MNYKISLVCNPNKKVIKIGLLKYKDDDASPLLTFNDILLLRQVLERESFIHRVRGYTIEQDMFYLNIFLFQKFNTATLKQIQLLVVNIIASWMIMYFFKKEKK